LEIKSDRMIHLGYGKYWRSDEIVGLLPIEEGRGPGRRTEVYVGTREEAIVASRSQQSILHDMASLPDEMAAAEARGITSDILDELKDLSPVLRRMLKNEGGMDPEYWIRRLEQLTLGKPDDEDQEDLFGAD